MTSGDASYGPIHAKKYFSCSPTWDVWNKITAKDVFALREERGFEGQQVYFALNNPIRYVYLCGLVLQFDLAPGAGASKYALLTLDDGSGRVIEVKIPRRQEGEDRESAALSSTLLKDVDVLMRMGLPTLIVNGKIVAIGSVVKVKGTIAVFRERQVDLKRMFVVKDTNEEVVFWAGVAKHRRDVLGRPWLVTQTQMDEVDSKIAAELKKEKARARKRKDWEAHHDQKRARRDEKMETERKKAEDKLNAGALNGSHLVKAPWD